MSNNMSEAPAATSFHTDDYDWDSDGQVKRGSSGVVILRADCDAVVKKPSWFGKETVFRPYPYLSDTRDTNSPFEPYRVIDATGRNKFSNWIRRYTCAWNVGNPATTFLIKRPAGAHVFDTSSTPLSVLFRAINNAIKRGQAHPEWPQLLLRTAGKSPSLAGPKECYVMQGAMFRHDGKDYFGQYGDPLGFGKNPPLVLLCSTGAGSILTGMLGEERENYRGDPADFEARYKYGDPVATSTGRFFYFFEQGHNPYQNRYASQPQAGEQSDGWGVSNQVGQKRTKDIGFDVHISQEFEGLRASFNQVGERIVRGKIRAWDEILYYPTEIEQAHMLFRCFPLSACMYAFEGFNRDWIPEDAKKRAVNATSVAVPAYIPDTGFGPPQQQFTHPGYATAAPVAPVQGWNTVPSQPAAKSKAQDNVVPQGDVGAVDASFGYPSTQPVKKAQEIVATPEAPEAKSPEAATDQKRSTENTAKAIAQLGRARSQA